MRQQIAILSQATTAVIELITNALTSEPSKRAYGKAIADFMQWRGNRPMTKVLVNEYRQTLTRSPALI